MIELLIIAVYLAVGAFFAGFLREDEGGWVMVIVVLWPAVLFAILGMIILSMPYELGKRLTDKKKENKNV